MQDLLNGPRYNSRAHYNNVKSALFDIDNTLVGNESHDLPSERLKQAVLDVRGKIKIGLATARPLSKVEHILEYIDAQGFSILCNGAQIIDSSTRRVVAEWVIKPETCGQIIDYIQLLDIKYWVNDGGEDYFPNRTSVNPYDTLSDIWNKDSERIAASGYTFNKPFVIVLHDITDIQVEQMTGFVARYTDDDTTLLIAHETYQPGGSKLYDAFIVHKLANKKDALHYIATAEGLNVSSFMAVGDGRNDAVLIQEVGVGIAMGNSAQETLDVATFITADQHNDGAAIALEYALKNLHYE